MASYQYGMPTYGAHAQNHQHHAGGRSRRGPRVSSSNAQRQYRAQKSPKEEAPQVQTYNDYLRVLEAARGFDFDDDEVFCPFDLLTEDDVCLAAMPPTLRDLELTSCHSCNLSIPRPPPTEARYRQARPRALLCNSKFSLHPHYSCLPYLPRTLR